jgi:phosphoserine phosphatase
LLAFALELVTDWLATTKHPKTGRLYTEMVNQPMLELLAHLRANGFMTFIVSGGGDEAQAKGWTVVSMKDDWKRVFSFEK